MDAQAAAEAAGEAGELKLNLSVKLNWGLGYIAALSLKALPRARRGTEWEVEGL